MMPTTCPQNKIWQYCSAADQIRKDEWERVLDDLRIKIDGERRKQMDVCLQSRKQGYAAMLKRTVLWDTVEIWMKELRSSKGGEHG